VIATFGQRGSAPGKFNVVGGIARDARGNFYVADMLKSAILVFDREYQFVKEFGYRGYGPGNLVAPASLAASEDKLFVAQVPRRGVSVFRIAEGPDATE
jgi:DNA-binding beta-propeller fold protein YncE